MPSPRPGRTLAWIVALVVVLAVAPRLVFEERPSAADLPGKLRDREFWRLVNTFSEPDGYFRSDNFLSNEIGFQRVIPDLTGMASPDGAYIGVGPEQNFTYLVALKPRIAFIIDIRRQNMLQHLLYKALIEESDTRADFLSRLFARPRPKGLGSGARISELFSAYSSVDPSEDLFKANLAAALERLKKYHGFTLTPADEQKIEYVYRAFYRGGPELDYTLSGGYGFGRGSMPSYADLMTATDDDGEHRSYLATEENFEVLKRLEANNQIVPLVGDFAGEKAIRGVGKYLKERDGVVTAFYTSNVEQYLFQQSDDWEKFLANVGTLPANERSVFIRSVPNRWYRRGTGFNRATTLLSPIAETVTAFNAGRIHSYADIVSLSR